MILIALSLACLHELLPFIFPFICIYIFGAIFLHITHWPHSVYIILIEIRADQLLLIYYHKITVFQQRGDRSRDRMVILCLFDSLPWWGVLDTTLCEFVIDLRQADSPSVNTKWHELTSLSLLDIMIIP